MTSQTRKRVEVLVQTVIGEYGYPFSLRAIEPTGAEEWRTTLRDLQGCTHIFDLNVATSLELYFSLRDELEKLVRPTRGETAQSA